MDSKIYSGATIIIFAFVGFLHALRAVYELDVSIGGITIPVWFSWVVVVISVIFIVAGFNLIKNKVS